MFKLLVILSLMIIPLKAFSSCPEIAGTYTCTGSGTTSKMVITQKNMTEFTFDLGEGPISFTANKKVSYTNNENGIYTKYDEVSKCSSDSIYFAESIKIIKGSNTHLIETSFIFKKFDVTNLSVSVDLSHKMNSEDAVAPIKGTVPCKKIL